MAVSGQATLQSGAIKLIFDLRTRLPGERVEGAVELDMGKASKDGVMSVRLKIRGVAATDISHEIMPVSISINPIWRGRDVFLKEEQSLWQADESEGPREGVLSLPFNFLLPKDAPSSFYLSNEDCTATITYGVEVIAEKFSIMPKRDLKVAQDFTVVTPASERQLAEAKTLGHGWDGKTTMSHATHEIKKMFSSSSNLQQVEAQVMLPALSSFPVGVPIPISLIVKARSKSMARSEESPSNSAMKSLFPALPSKGADVQFWLGTHHLLTAKPNDGWAEPTKKLIEHRERPLDGFGGAAALGQVVISQEKVVWVPDPVQDHGKGRGRWECGVRFDSIISLACSPTMDFGIINSAWDLRLEVPFSGMGNNLHLKVPVHVNSGVDPLRNIGVPPSLVLPVPCTSPTLSSSRSIPVSSTARSDAATFGSTSPSFDMPVFGASSIIPWSGSTSLSPTARGDVGTFDSSSASFDDTRSISTIPTSLLQHRYRVKVEPLAAMSSASPATGAGKITASDKAHLFASRAVRPLPTPPAASKPAHYNLQGTSAGASYTHTLTNPESTERPLTHYPNFSARRSMPTPDTPPPMYSERPTRLLEYADV